MKLICISLAGCLLAGCGYGPTSQTSDIASHQNQTVPFALATASADPDKLACSASGSPEKIYYQGISGLIPGGDKDITFKDVQLENAQGVKVVDAYLLTLKDAGHNILSSSGPGFLESGRVAGHQAFSPDKPATLPATPAGSQVANPWSQIAVGIKPTDAAGGGSFSGAVISYSIGGRNFKDHEDIAATLPGCE